MAINRNYIYRRPGIPGPRASVGEIVPGLYQRSLFTTSAFIVITPPDAAGLDLSGPGGAAGNAASDAPSVAIIDSGWRYFHNRPVLDYLRQLGYGPASVQHLIATHWHPDHIGGMAGLQRATGAAAAAHRLEADAIAGRIGEVIPQPAAPRWLRALLRPVRSSLAPPPFPVSTLLDDGDTLPLLGGARVIHTPGHTPGSVSLHFPAEGVLLVGDAVQRVGNRLTLPSRWFSSDMTAAKASVRKLAELDFDTICFSHFQPLRRGAPAALRTLAEYVS